MPQMKILLLGANGFIGSIILMRLLRDGHEVTGLGRQIQRSMRRWPMAKWVARDLANMTGPEAWHDLIQAHDVIINCAGALQDGQADDLVSTQLEAMRALYHAASLASGKKIVQISARTDGLASNLPFLATKRCADEALAASGVDFVILRPALVLGRNAHGGSALLRALASIPVVIPLVHAASTVQTVAVDDVADAVSKAVEGDLPSGTDIDLSSKELMTLSDLVKLHRRWLGLTSGRVLPVPRPVAALVSQLADLSGKLGWRSPLRSTAIAVMEHGVTGGGQGRCIDDKLSFQTARQTLDAHPAGVQDLWFARLYLLKPVILLCLSTFWLLSGLIPLLNPERAAFHLLPFMPPFMAMFVTLATCGIDIALGVFLLIRPFAARALIGMLVVAASYLLAGTILEPGLWLDPLGPLVKVLPSLSLCLVALATLDER